MKKLDIKKLNLYILIAFFRLFQRKRDNLSLEMVIQNFFPIIAIAIYIDRADLC